MRFLKERLGRWTVPVMLSALLIVAAGVTTAVGAKFITGKKVNKTIAKKTQATELRVTGPRTPGGSFDPNAASSLMATLSVPQGPHVVTTTFSERKDTGGLALSCKLRIPGVGEDGTDFFGGGGQIQEPAAMSVAGTLKSAGSAELRCYDGSAAADSEITRIEITALKVPKITNQSIP